MKILEYIPDNGDIESRLFHLGQKHSNAKMEEVTGIIPDDQNEHPEIKRVYLIFSGEYDQKIVESFLLKKCNLILED